jgi:tripartite-type tricarboxylate transporter receptor subunit TctC
MRKLAIALLASALVPFAVANASYPEKAVRIVVPYPAGGPTDIAGRLIAQELSKRLNQSFFVDNRGGAAGNIGAELVAKATPDGYTLLMIGAAHVINKSLYKQLSYDIQRDFVTVATVSTAPHILLSYPGFTASNVKDLVKLGKARPGAINYCSAGSGTSPHLVMELLKATASIDLVHVPYKGSTPCLMDVIGGQASICFDSVVIWPPYSTSGKLRALAVTGAKRSPIASDVLTMAESGFPEVEGSVWYGVAAPSKTPVDVLQFLNNQITDILSDIEVSKRLLSLGAEPLPLTRAEFTKFIDAEVAKWAKVVKTSGARID